MKADSKLLHYPSSTTTATTAKLGRLYFRISTAFTEFANKIMQGEVMKTAKVTWPISV